MNHCTYLHSRLLIVSLFTHLIDLLLHYGQGTVNGQMFARHLVVVNAALHYVAYCACLCVTLLYGTESMVCSLLFTLGGSWNGTTLSSHPPQVEKVVFPG